MRTWVLHLDLDEFLAAVEVLRRPELAGLPVVVGGRGDPSERGVVATASYQARAFGVRSGMPLRTAARKLPEEAVFLPADHAAYEAASAEVMETLRSWVDRDPGAGGARVTALEVLGWDEAFLAAAATSPGPDDPEPLARALQQAVLERTSLHCSVGIGDNKLQAKTATGFGKPRGTGRLESDQWSAVMGQRPVTALWGIGTKTARRLADLGISTVAELGAADTAALAAQLGPTLGPWYRRLGRGVDSSPVDPTPWVPRAHGRETTFQRDLEDWAEVAQEVRRLAAQVAEDIATEGRPAARVGVKVRYVPFETRQRSLTLPEPSGDAAVVGDAAVSLVDRFDHTRRVRLVGVRAEMTPPPSSRPS
ncbi:MAG: DNA polymerase-like protein MT3142 [uncultured Nocardioidaceae bacterium]|uniref:DNA polymerase-like protein MT3142 n=1 Tax=uncultured Nocardioidaceae bacterium TaxID=253824 RepID=A0A6J4MQ20_9ACTN|nr:MAG: DNA polymerase-like protein MT3142 [uncultured Nocardioidaceae bacterium]